MLRGIGFEFSPVKGHVPQCHQPRLLAQREDLREQLAQRPQMALSKVADRAKVGRLPRRHSHEVDPLLTRDGDPPRGVAPLAVGIQQQRRHHDGGVWRMPAVFRVGLQDGRQVQRVSDQVPHEMSQMPRGNQLMNRRGQQHHLINVPRFECFRHAG